MRSYVIVDEAIIIVKIENDDDSFLGRKWLVRIMNYSSNKSILDSPAVRHVARFVFPADRQF